MRAASLCLLSTLPAIQLANYVHPRLYSLHDMPEDAGLPSEQGIILPPVLNLNSRFLESHGLYLLDNGQIQFLYIGRDAVPRLLQDVFDVSDIEHVKAGKGSLPLLENPFSERVNAVIAKSKQFFPGSMYWPHLYIVRDDGDPQLRRWFFAHMVEDHDQIGFPSYVQYLSQLRDKINS